MNNRSVAITEDEASMDVTRPVFLTGALLAALGAASWLPDSQGPGLFLPIVAGLSLLALFGANAIPREPWNIAFAVLALALASLATVRTAVWIVVPSLLVAAGMIVLSISRARSWLSLFLSSLKPVLHIGQVPKFIFYSAGLSRRLHPERTVAVVRTSVIAGILLLVFGALFASADRAFAQILEQASPDWDLGLIPIRLLLFIIVLTAVTGLAITGQKLSEEDPEETPNVVGPRIGYGEWFVSLLLLDVLFATFVAVQFTVLFGGHDVVLRTAGLTYAEYAREGFFQLLFAAGLSLGVVWGASTWSVTETPKSKLMLKTLLGVLCLLTLVILFSALKRLGLYEEAFGFTRARLTGHAIAWWLGGIFVMALVAGAISSTRWFPRATIAYTALAMVVFAGINPESLIAKENLERAERTGKIDVEYLLDLGPDAVPVLAAQPPGSNLRACLLWQQHLSLEEESWSDFNWSRYKAGRLLDKEALKEAHCEVGPETPFEPAGNDVPPVGT